jgi:nucleotide-binding universal stress UspA family protein
MGSQITLLSAVKNETSAQKDLFEDTCNAREVYLQGVNDQLASQFISVSHQIRPGSIADATRLFVDQDKTDLVVTTTRGKSGAQHWITGGVSRKLAQNLKVPILLVKALNGNPPNIQRILVALDGSIKSEQALPYARTFAKSFNSELILLSVPAVPESTDYRAAPEVVESLRQVAEVNMGKFLDAVARSLREEGISVQTIVTGTRPASTIVQVSEEVDADMIMITSRGRGGMDLLMMGSEAHRVVEHTDRLVLLIPVHQDPE